MGVVCRATSNSDSRGIGDEEVEELIVDDVVVKSRRWFSRHASRFC